MPVSEAKKRANDKWGRANMTMLGCKVYRDKAAVFKQTCLDAGTTMNSVFTDAMDCFLREHGIDPDQFRRS